MTTRSNRFEQLREDVVPAASEFLHNTAEVVAPWAEAARHTAGAAAEKVSALAHEAVAKGAPLAQQAVERSSPLAQQAVEKVSPYAQQAVQKAAPYAALAKEKVTGDALPRMGTVLAAAAPVLRRVRRDTDEPVVAAPPKRRGRWLGIAAVVAAGAAAAYLVARRLLGDRGSQWQNARPSSHYVPPTSSPSETSSTGNGSGTSAETAELYGQPPSGGVAPDDPDTKAEEDVNALIENEANADEEVPPVPATPGRSDGSGIATAGSSSTTPDAGSDYEADTTGDTSDQSEHTTDNVKDTTDRESPVPPAEYASATADESSPADDASAAPDAPVSTSEDNSAGVGPDAHPTIWSDQGAYVGTEPPPGFAIKANERSMKYHLPESSGYTRTLSEVWFDSEEKAQAAGFVRAQR